MNITGGQYTQKKKTRAISPPASRPACRLFSASHCFRADRLRAAVHQYYVMAGGGRPCGCRLAADFMLRRDFVLSLACCLGTPAVGQQASGATPQEFERLFQRLEKATDP